MAGISNFWQRILTGSIFLIIMIGSIVISFQSFLLVCLLINILATREYLKIVSTFCNPNKGLVYFTNIFGSFALTWFLFFDDSISIGLTPGKHIVRMFLVDLIFQSLLVLFPVIIIASEMLRRKEKTFENAVYGVIGFIYIAVPFMLLIQSFETGFKNYEYKLALAYFLLLWSTDSFAYVWGKLLGKHKLAPSISAGKTIEGTIGGILTTMGFSVAFPYIFPGIDLSLIEWIIFGGLIAVFAVPSDLSESLLKRKAGLKDSGNLLPGHGGILDRFDSVLLTAPIIYIYTHILINT